jgi:hypothetical protein
MVRFGSRMGGGIDFGGGVGAFVVALGSETSVTRPRQTA